MVTSALCVSAAIQEKVVAKTTRTATDALYLNLSLNIPFDLPCSFSTPLFQLCYRLHVDFCLDEPGSSSGESGGKGSQSGAAKGQGAGMFADAFTFSVPIQVLQAAQHRVADELPPVPGSAEKESTGAQGERIAPSRSSVASVQQQALRCLEGDIVVAPLRAQ
jgi:hypothetical protein